MNQYDTLDKAKDYDKWINEAIFVKYVQEPSVLKLLGNLNGKKVIEYACGSGHYTNILAKNAEKIVGVDISSEMIDIARKYKSASNVEYHVNNCEEILNLGTYDVVLAVFLINYAKTKEMLKNFLISMYNSLKQNGICCGMTNNPMLRPDEYHFLLKYSLRFTAKDPKFEESNEICINFLDNFKNQSLLEITVYYLHPTIIEETFKQVGFVNFKWIKLTIGDGYEKYHELLADYLDHPNAILYYAEKP